MELHEQPLRLLRRAVHVVDAEVDRVLARLLRHVARIEVLVPVSPGLAAVVREPDADRRDRERDARRIARPGRDRVHAHAARARAPVGTRRLLPERLVQLPARAAVVALEEDARRAACVQVVVVLGGHDRPEALERLLGVLGELDAARLLPLGREVVGVEDLRPVERRGHAGERAARCARRASRTRPARRRNGATSPRMLAAVALEHEQALLRSDQKLSHCSPS